MIPINTYIKANKKFSTANLGCFLRLPLTKHNLAFASLLAKLQMNATLYFPSIRIQQEELLKLYDLQFEVMPQLFGKEIILSYIFSYVEPDEILDPEYNYQTIIEHFAMLTLHPTFDADLVRISQKQLLAEYHELISEPSNYAIDRFFKYWYQDNPDYAENFMGPVKEITSATPGQLMKFSENLRSVPMIVAGFARDNDLVTKLLVDKFKAAGLMKKFEDSDLVIPATKMFIKKVEEQGNFQTQLLIGYGYQEKQTFQEQILGMLLAQYLAGDSSSILFTKVREEVGAAYDIEANNYANNCLFLISTGIDDEKTKLVQEIIVEEIEKIKSGDIQIELFKQAKNSLKNEQLIGADHLNWCLAQVLRENLFPDYIDFDRLDAIKKATTVQMQRFAQKLTLKESYILK